MNAGGKIFCNFIKASLLHTYHRIHNRDRHRAGSGATAAFCASVDSRKDRLQGECIRVENRFHSFIQLHRTGEYFHAFFYRFHAGQFRPSRFAVGISNRDCASTADPACTTRFNQIALARSPKRIDYGFSSLS